MIRKVEEFIVRASKMPKTKLAVASAEDITVLEAVIEAKNLGFVEPILFGVKKELETLLIQLNQKVEDYLIVGVETSEQAAKEAVAYIRRKQADVLMKGLLDTKVLLKAVVHKEEGIKEQSVLSHIGLVSYPNENRIFFITDGAMLPEPTVEQKIKIIENAVDLAKAIEYQEIRVGLVSSVEKVNERIPSSIDAHYVVEHFKNNPIEGVFVDGPFAMDNLVSEEAAHHKGITSPVAGLCDVFVFPNIDGGNIFYKTSVFLGKADSAGIVIGAKAPIVLTSRADSKQSKLYSIALSVMYYQGKLQKK
jgi:phosphate butyryltransferase